MVNNDIGMLGAGEYMVEGGDSIIFYYGSFPPDTLIPSIDIQPSQLKSGETMVVIISSTYYDWGTQETKTVFVEGAVVEFDGTEYLTDDNGQVSICLEQSGSYTLKVRKDVEGSYPVLVRTSPIILEVLEGSDGDEGEIIEKPEPDEVLSGVESWFIERKENLSDWAAIGLALNGYNDFEDYYTALLNEISENEGNYSKITDLQRIALVIHLIGEDPLDVGGYNLIEKIYNNNNMLKQGINGPIFSLIVLDSGDFIVPEGSQWDRDKLIDEILNRQNSDGGFSLSEGSSDVDITAMAIQALAKYKDRESVNTALDEAVSFLSNAQSDNGGYNNITGEQNSQSVSQVIMALCFMGIDIESDGRFIKSDKSLLDNLYTYLADAGGFKNVLTQDSNPIATEQAFLALIAYKNFLQDNEGTIFYREYVYEEEDDEDDEEDGDNDDNNGGNNNYGRYRGSSSKYTIPNTEKEDHADVTVKEDYKTEKVEYEDIIEISDWAVENVIKGTELGLVKGYDNYFNPKGNITRAEFAAIVTRILNDNEQKEYEQVFEDVAADSWYFMYVMKAYEKGIVKGTSEHTFSPDELITREEMAVMFSRLLELPLDIEKVDIVDLDLASDWAKEHIKAVFNNGIMLGSDGYFNPQEQVTREMAAVIAVRVYEILMSE